MRAALIYVLLARLINAILLKCNQFYSSVNRYDLSNDDNYSQAGLLYRKVLPKDEQNRLVENITDNLKHAADFLQVLF